MTYWVSILVERIFECGTQFLGLRRPPPPAAEKKIAILGDRWWPQKAKQHGDKIGKKFLCNI